MQKAHRGELWLIDLGMVQKTRPCLILSINFLDHERGGGDVCPAYDNPASDAI